MGAQITKLRWGGDPDVPDPISGLSLRDIYTVQRSWSPIHAEAGKYGFLLFLRVFQADPNTKNFFKIIKDMNEEQLTKSIMFKAHVVNVMSAINSAVLNLDHPEIVMALMNKLGVSHHKQNVRVQDFEVLKVVLINILKNDLKMIDASLESWTRFVDFIYQHIFVKLYDSQKLL